MTDITYEVWVLGYDKYQNITDFDLFIKDFEDKEEAIKFAEKYYYKETLPKGVCYYEVVVETVVNNSNIETVYGRLV